MWNRLSGFQIYTRQNLVLLLESNTTEQIFRTLAYFINIFSMQILGYITVQILQFSWTFYFLSYILLHQMPPQFLHCTEKHHHSHTDKFIYLLKAISIHLGDSTSPHKCFLFTETLLSKVTKTFINKTGLQFSDSSHHINVSLILFPFRSIQERNLLWLQQWK